MKMLTIAYRLLDLHLFLAAASVHVYVCLCVCPPKTEKKTAHDKLMQLDVVITVNPRSD